MSRAKLKWFIAGLVGLTLVLGILIGVAALVPKEYLETREERAAREARDLLVAVKGYYMERGKWPARLLDATPYLENPRLVDPWGAVYKYSIVPVTQVDGVPCERPYVWSECVVDGEVKVCGMKPDDLV